jgi:glyoxylase I family protein
MSQFALHHVSLPVRDLAVSAAFYDDVLGLPRLPRPGFDFTGLWYACGAGQLHLIVNAKGSFRAAPLSTRDAHYALSTDDFDAVIDGLTAHGYSETAAEDDPKRLRVKRDSVVAFAQAFLMDPDGHIIEINRARD